MTVKTLMPVRNLNLVAPLAQKATDMHITDTAARAQAWSGAVAPLIGSSLWQGDVSSANLRSTPRTTPGIRTSTTATRTTTTRSTSAVAGSSAASNLPTFDQLVQAYLDCRQHKRSSSSCQAFEAHLERNLCALYEELIEGGYHPGRSICFVITHPKPREVWAAEFRDRIVHHLLYNHIARRFIAGFVAGSSACIPGRGTLYAAKRLEHGIRSITENWSKPAFYLKMDLANFFVAIDKHVLFEQIAAKVHEPFWLELAKTILFHDPRENVEVRGSRDLLAKVPPHKSLFNAPADTGLPIGNLSSQFFANVHLDALDKFCVHHLKARSYVRYVDDFVMLADSTAPLVVARDAITAFLPGRLGAQVNPRKTILQPVDRGVDFVGQVIKPWRRTTRARTVRSAMREVSDMPAANLFASGNSYLGLLRQASHSHSAQAEMTRLLRLRGHVVAGNLNKIYRKTQC
jgi:RNA-directed DNA polymerase